MSFNWWLLALYLAKGGDFASTEYALRAPGIQEMNLLAQQQWARVAMLAAAPAAVEWTASSLVKRDHPRWAMVVRISAISLWGLAVAHNLRQYDQAARGR